MANDAAIKQKPFLKGIRTLSVLKKGSPDNAPDHFKFHSSKDQEVIIPIKIGNVREFDGQGINLCPKRLIKGGLAIWIQ